MDSETFVQKLSDVIYKTCNRKRRYQDIMKNLKLSIELQEEDYPYYHEAVLNVLDDMSIITDNNNEEFWNTVENYCKELFLSNLSETVTKIFQDNFEDDEEVVNEFSDHYKQEFERTFKYEVLLEQETKLTVKQIREITEEFTKNLDVFDFDTFDKTLTSVLYDCINCSFEDEDEDEDESEEDESEEDESEEDESEEDEGNNNKLQILVDFQLNEIVDLKQQLGEKDEEIVELRNAIQSYDLTRRDVNSIIAVGFLCGYLLMLISSFTETKVILSSDLLK